MAYSTAPFDTDLEVLASVTSSLTYAEVGNLT